jgi:DNA-binding NarL/FixJ family response regulator
MPSLYATLLATSDSEFASELASSLSIDLLIAPSFRVALAEIRRAHFRIVLIDSELDGGDAIGLGLVVRRVSPTARAIFLHHHDRWVSKEAASALGFDQLINRSAGSSHIAKALSLTIDKVRVEKKSHLDSLSKREREIYSHLEQGLRNIEIAELYNISLATTKSHISSIYRKLGVRNRVEAIAKGRS